MSQPKIDPSTKNFWSEAGKTLITPLEMTIAGIFAHPFFICKSDAQLGLLTNFKEACKKPGKVSWVVTLAGTAWFQIELQKIFQKNFFNPKENSSDTVSKLLPTILSSVGVGIFSVPSLAILNGLTIGKTIRSSLTQLTIATSAALVLRESCFVFGISAIEPLKESLEKSNQKSPFYKYGIAILSGSFASLLSHPADTTVSLSQKGKRITNISQLMKGSLWRTAGVALFTLVYIGSQEGIEFAVDGIQKNFPFKK